MIEKRIYSPWAYKENYYEKMKMNDTIYHELLNKYKVSRTSTIWNDEKKCLEEINFDEYDVIVENSGVGYGHTIYSVIKNEPKLSYDELALICDNGNLCFGYDIEYGRICIYTD